MHPAYIRFISWCRAHALALGLLSSAIPLAFWCALTARLFGAEDFFGATFARLHPTVMPLVLFGFPAGALVLGVLSFRDDEAWNAGRRRLNRIVVLWALFCLAAASLWVVSGLGRPGGTSFMTLFTIG